MPEIFSVPIRILGFFAAVGLAPYLAVRTLHPRLLWADTLAITGLATILVNTAIPVIFHVLSVPIRPNTLAGAHVVLLVAGVAAYRLWRVSPFPRRLSRTDLPVGLLLLLLALALLPVTRLTGIDTYKWQDLAGAVAVEHDVPWLTHPLSLLGFTARAYPSAHPLMLASIQIIGGLGVDWGFYVISLFTALVGFACACSLGQHIVGHDPDSPTFPDKTSPALWFAALYVLSPVFLRYSYWATGRGLFLAVLPLFIRACLQLPRRAAWGTAVASATALALSHRTGIPAMIVIAPALLLSPATRWARTRTHVVWLSLPFALLALALAPSLLLRWPLGTPLGAARLLLSRYGWYVPVALAGLLLRPAADGCLHRRLLLPTLVTLPLACVEEMYGAMIALPFITGLAVNGLGVLAERVARHGRRLACLAAVLTVAGAGLILIHRARPAMPRRVYRAAVFLQAHDPEGPFRIEAPGLNRRYMQAYLSGCPRFSIDRTGPVSVTLLPEGRPTYDGNLQEHVRDWIQYLRNAATVTGTETHAYGGNPRVYQVTIDGEGDHPSGATPIYSRDGVRVYTSP